MPDRGFEIAAHPRGKRAGLRKPLPEENRGRVDRTECPVMTHPKRGDGHDPPRVQPGAARDVFGEWQEPPPGPPPPPRAPADAELEQPGRRRGAPAGLEQAP